VSDFKIKLADTTKKDSFDLQSPKLFGFLKKFYY